MKVNLSVLGAAKTESGYNTRCKSFCSAMIDACAKWAALMNRPENNFRLWGRRKFNFSLILGQNGVNYFFHKALLRCLFRTMSNIYDGAFYENSEQLKIAKYSCRKLYHTGFFNLVSVLLNSLMN